jgi:hypothetical protein
VKAKKIADNVATYINLDEACHITNGVAYVTAQFLNLFVFMFVVFFKTGF